jgi:integrase
VCFESEEAAPRNQPPTAFQPQAKPISDPLRPTLSLAKHALRHTCATLLLSKNVNQKIVSEMLGHATIAITLDAYSHVLPTMQKSAAKAMKDALS